MQMMNSYFAGLGGGHYTAFCKMPDDNKWYLFDDSSVRLAEADCVVSPAAYLLFYRQKGSKVRVTFVCNKNMVLSATCSMLDFNIVFLSIGMLLGE